MRMALIATLLVVGFVLLLLETVLPGLIAGAIGLVCIVASVVISYGDLGARQGNMVLLLVIALLVAGAFCWLKFFPDSPMARIFISNRVIGNVGAERPELINLTGIAHTALRPSGTALIAGKKVDVVTEGDFIQKGEALRVVAVEGLRVVVRKT
jgi:membrane-bound serine protease (ClpP class)